MKYSVLFHMIIGCIMYTNSNIFSEQETNLFQKDVDKYLEKLSNLRFFDDRFDASHS